MDIDDKKSKLLRPSLLVALVTLVSRILGLLRVRFEASVLGGGAFASAWFLAFSIPNLFRRLFGEGALGTALTPLVAGIEQEQGRSQLRRELAVIFAALSCVLCIIVVIMGCGSVGLRILAHKLNWTYFCNPRMDMALQLLPLLMPYAFFMCLVGAATAVLNYMKVFVLPACGALLLNIFLIGGLAWTCFRGGRLEDLPELLPVLSILVLISGFFQLILTSVLLYCCGCFPKLDFSVFRKTDVLKKLFNLSLPGMIAASVLQVSFLIDRFLAAKLNDQAIPALSFVDRLIDLPIGLFAVSLGSVLMSSMSRAAAEKDFVQLREQLLFSLRHVYFICIPMAAGVMFFHVPLLRMLCLGGNYTAQDLEAARLVAVFYSAGIPLFCSVKVLLPAFYSRKEMKKPLAASVTAICVNIVLNLLLMGPLKQGGIALATVISSVVNNAMLFYFLRKDGLSLPWKELAVPVGRAIAVSGVVCLVLYMVYTPFEKMRTANRLLDGCGTIVLFAVFGGLYLLLARLTCAPEPAELLSVFKNRNKK